MNTYQAVIAELNQLKAQFLSTNPGTTFRNWKVYMCTALHNEFMSYAPVHHPNEFEFSDQMWMLSAKFRHHGALFCIDDKLPIRAVEFYDDMLANVKVITV